jgi:hypothetical protein
MPKIMDTAAIAEKYGRVTPARQTDFEAGVKAPMEDWGAKASAAEGNYNQGVQTAIANKSFGKGVARAGTAKWQRKTLDVGVGRWGTGVRAGQADFQSGFDPYAKVIAGTTLPPRYPKGDPRNMDRVAGMAKALHDAKIK